jgi:hypothetical protein
VHKRQATSQPLLHLSSATNVDNEIGQLASNETPILSSSSPNPAIVHLDAPYQQPLSWEIDPTQRRPTWVNWNTRFTASFLSLVCPGGVLIDTRLANMLYHSRQQLDTKNTRLWNVAERHLNPEAREQAFTRITGVRA